MGPTFHALPYGSCVSGFGNSGASLDLLVFPHDKVTNETLETKSKALGQLLADSSKGFTVQPFDG
eukprot:619727-Amphidinium_carterae.1